MRAAVLKPDQNNLIVEELPIPEVLDEEVLIKVKACGICHTDLHYIDHGVKTFKPRPIVLGHEATGIIEKTGSKVKNFSVGNRVIIPAVLTCGECRYCKTHRSNLCLNMQMLGNHINGAYAEYISVNSKDLQLLPDEVSFEEGALIADALSTAYHAVFNRASVKPDDTVMVFGCGGVGISIIQMCRQQTDNIIAVDIKDSKLKLAIEFGAKEVINLEKENIFDRIQSMAPEGVDIIFEVVGLKPNFELAVKLASPSTTVCIVGYISEKASINCAKLMFYELNILGSLGCCPDDIPKILHLLKARKINIEKMISQTFPLDDINLALDKLRLSDGLRPVITFK